MKILTNIPTTLAEMLNVLKTGVQTGLFDSVSYDSADSPTKILCNQGGNIILSASISGSAWTFTPYVKKNTSAATNHCMTSKTLETVCICSDGMYFLSTSTSGTKTAFVIAKTDSGKTGFVCWSRSSTFTIASSVLYFPTCYGDNTTLSVYSQGFKIQGNYATADRTILSPIPVAGDFGSGDYFKSVFARVAVQYADIGIQNIGGKKYACIYHAAILDE